MICLLCLSFTSEMNAKLGQSVIIATLFQEKPPSGRLSVMAHSHVILHNEHVMSLS